MSVLEERQNKRKGLTGVGGSGGSGVSTSGESANQPEIKPVDTVNYRPGDLGAPAKPVIPSAADVNPEMKRVDAGSYNPEAWYRADTYDAAAKYNPNATRKEYLAAHARYRKDNNMGDMSFMDVVNALNGGDPNKSKAQEDAEKKKMKRATMLNAVGDLLLNLYNYGRTKAGNPAMDLSGMGEKGRNRLERLRAYQEQLGRQNYNVYMNALKSQRSAEADAAATERKYLHEMQVEALKQRNPLNKARIDTEAARKGYYDEQTRGKQIENEWEPKISAAEEAAARALAYQRNTAAAKNGKKEFLEVVGKDGKIRVYSSDNGANWIEQAYQDVLDATGGDKSPYKIRKSDLWASPAVKASEMYDVVTRYNNDMRDDAKANRYKRKKGEGKAPIS